MVVIMLHINTFFAVPNAIELQIIPSLPSTILFFYFLLQKYVNKARKDFIFFECRWHHTNFFSALQKILVVIFKQIFY